jgi:hypothetical protein
MRRIGTLVILFGSIANVIAGCGTAHTPVPAGAHQVHVVATASDLRVSPATVHAGDVYVVMDTVGAVKFVQRQTTAAGTPGPLSDADLVRLGQGDEEFTATQGFELAGCDPPPCTREQPWMGYGGNAFKVVLSPGKYAFLVDDPNGKGSGFIPPKSMVVLQVLP